MEAHSLKNKSTRNLLTSQSLKAHTPNCKTHLPLLEQFANTGGSVLFCLPLGFGPGEDFGVAFHFFGFWGFWLENQNLSLDRPGIPLP